MTEEWRPIPGFDGYEVSDLGRVRGVDRWVAIRTGGQRLQRGRILRAHPLPHTGHMIATLRKDYAAVTVRVHALVAAAFIGPRPSGLDVCHNNGDPADNRVSNLRYDSRSANIKDAVLHGTHNMSRKTHCKSGHPFDDENTIPRTSGGRDCATCRYERSRASRERRRARVA